MTVYSVLNGKDKPVLGDDIFSALNIQPTQICDYLIQVKEKKWRSGTIKFEITGGDAYGHFQITARLGLVIIDDFEEVGIYLLTTHGFKVTRID